MPPPGPDHASAAAATAPQRGPSLVSVVSACWALFFGMALVMLGNGLQGSLLGLRATLEGFPTAATGLVMSGYFAGFAAGSVLAPRLVARVGHIRVFAALASLASIVALTHLLSITPASWGVMRLMTGFCYAGIYVVAESWLNDRAANEARGQLLAVYMVVLLGGAAGGPLLLNLADPGGVTLFIVVSVLVSLGLIPILLTTGPAPRFEATVKVRLKQLYRISPLGFVACGGMGVANGAMVGLGAVYAEKIGLSVALISLFMGSFFLGGVLWQWPVGWISDRFGRRWVLAGATFLAAFWAVLAVPVAAVSVPGLMLLVWLFGGAHFPMYSLGIAHTNDRLDPEQMVAASSGLVLIAGSTAAFGPFSAAAVMSFVGPGGFFWFLAAVHGVVGLFALYRTGQRAAPSLEEQIPTIPVSSTSAVAGASAMESAREEFERVQDEDQAS
jgi:MFS family permease